MGIRTYADLHTKGPRLHEAIGAKDIMCDKSLQKQDYLAYSSLYCWIQPSSRVAIRGIEVAGGYLVCS